MNANLVFVADPDEFSGFPDDSVLVSVERKPFEHPTVTLVRVWASQLAWFERLHDARRQRAHLRAISMLHQDIHRWVSTGEMFPPAQRYSVFCTQWVTS